jgi:hypothetical protein
MVTGRFARGREALKQSLRRAVNTEPGTLRGGPEELAWGIDLPGYLGEVGSPAAVQSIPGLAAAQWKKDDRVSSVAIVATITTEPNGDTAILLSSNVVPVDDGEQFPLTLKITDVTVEIVGGVS